MVSNVTGEVAGEELCSAAYWVAHVRETVRFADGVKCLRERGVTRFVELGPDGALTSLVHECLDGDEDAGMVVVPMLRKDPPEPESAVLALGHLYVHGAPVDLRSLFPEPGPYQHVDLPTYAFQRQRFWPEGVGVGVGDVSSVGLEGLGHPLVGAVVSVPGSGGVVLTGRLSVGSLPWLVDHAVLGSVVLPGTAFVELAVVAGDRVGASRVEELTLHAPLVIPEQSDVQIQVVVDEVEQETGVVWPVSVYSRPYEDDRAECEWTRHATGTLVSAASSVPPDGLRQWPPTDAEAVSIEGLYDWLGEIGVSYGPVFRGLRAAWRSGGDVFAEVALADAVVGDAAGFGVHPALLDAALHAVGLGEFFDDDVVVPRLPFVWSGVSVFASGAAVLRVRVSRVGDGVVSVLVADASGVPVASVDSLVLRPVAVGELSS
ncbi:polyketide synthase dehydratase domain-containing protein, partial [Streptomyces solisilvae]|uniref:polyketide synthase dehydratase domain-containing protein n=1 Tax=Streptomyces malaysiensis TaxID=92644 RepID=UPI00332D8B88